jgi:hypothetical protein
MARYSGSVRDFQKEPPVWPMPPAEGSNGFNSSRLVAGAAVLINFVTTSKFLRD